MPKRSESDQASSRTSRERGTACLRQLLSRDFSSPLEVLAEPRFCEHEKRRIFQVWIRDFTATESDGQTHQLLDEIREAMARLDGEDDGAFHRALGHRRFTFPVRRKREIAIPVP